MIVVDADVIAAFWIKSPRTQAAYRVRARDSDWIVPVLWRSEFRSVIRQHLMHGSFGFADASWIVGKAEAMLHGREFSVSSHDVLRLVNQTGHSSYDCEYVALAEARGIKLITGDQRLTHLFPDIAVLMEEFATP